MEVSAEYLAALATWRAAASKYEAIRTKYRRREIDDSEFIAARRTFDAAQKVFDDVTAAEDNR